MLNDTIEMRCKNSIFTIKNCKVTIIDYNWLLSVYLYEYEFWKSVKEKEKQPSEVFYEKRCS